MKLFYGETDIYGDVSVNYCVHEMYAEGQADTLVIRFNDPDGLWSKWNPATGDEIRFTEGSGDTGKMFIHSMKSENGLFTIRAQSMPASGKVRRSKSWEGVRFLQVGNEIAARHGLTFRSFGCADQVYPSLKQDNEGDFALFSRLCTFEGCQMIIYDGALIAYRERYIEEQTPQEVLEIAENGVFSYKDNRTACFGSCEVSSGSYFGKFEIPDTEFTRVLRPEYPVRATSNAEAARFARGLLRNANKYGRTGRFTRSLMTGYAAASLAELKTPKASAWDGPVFIYKVRHDYAANKTTIYFRDIPEGY